MGSRQTVKLELSYNDDDGTVLTEYIQTRNINEVARMCSYEYKLDSNDQAEVPVPVLAFMLAAYEAVHVLRPSRPILSGDDPYSGGDPFIRGAAPSVYWRIDPSRSAWELELYSKLSSYLPYVGDENDDFDVHFFNKCDEDRDKLLLVMTALSTGEASLKATVYYA